ncbi:DUF1236 domain-containing protein [Afipia sp. P52-10]|uniref:DUF1236 domain-containing protein n=1 Tax=Afipia sp. P52-10 TaxID=1429916 RepID=UPI0004B9B00E|nr:DUF1236 domain-containing protein [Afipia sp. P52-10]
MTIKTIVLAAMVAAIPAVASAQATMRNGTAPAPIMDNPVDETGHTIGSAVTPTPAQATIPDAVLNQVRGSHVRSISVNQQIAPGERLPKAVHLHAVHDYPKYRFAVVNDQRMIVDPHSRKIMQIVQ